MRVIVFCKSLNFCNLLLKSTRNHYCHYFNIKYSMSATQRKLVVYFVPVLVILFLFSPDKFAKSFWDGLCIWAINVLPVLLPFGFFSTLWTSSINTSKFSFTQKLFGINCDKIFISSLICGYPVGAQQIVENCTDKNQAERMLSFCSTSSPIFIIGTVGARFLQNTTAAVIVATSQIIGCIINGLAYRKIIPTGSKLLINTLPQSAKQQNIFDTLLNCILSVLSVGAIIALFVMLSEMLSSIFPSNITTSTPFGFILGLLETTNGIMLVSRSATLLPATVLTSTLLSFGGLSVFIQSLSYVAKLKVNVARLLVMKITQCAFTTIISFILCLIIL